MNSTIYKVNLTFTEPVLGSQSTREVVTEWINPDLPDDEAAALPEKLEKATTVFHKVDGKPVLFDYHIKGFLKNAARVYNGLKSAADDKGKQKSITGITALRSKVDNYVFVFPRIIPLELSDNTAEIEYFERPLQAQTAQGPRIALARSEILPAGTKLSFTIEIMDGSPIDDDMLRMLLEYGSRCGLGQWRNGGYGRFDFTIENGKK